MVRRKVYRTCGNVRPKSFVVVVVFGPLLRAPSTTESLGVLGNPITRATRVVRSLGLRGGLSMLGPVHLKPGRHRTTGTLGLLTEWSRGEEVFTGHVVFRAGSIHLPSKEVRVFIF